jgi:hypothetical protein
MRSISELEKQIINRICDGQTHISTLLTDHIQNLILEVDRDTEKVTLILHNSKDQKDLLSDATSQTEMIIYIIKFLLYLENEGYIMTGNFAHGRTVLGKYVTIENFDKYNQNQNDYTNWHFTDNKIEQYIFMYTDLTIFPSYLLKAFKKRNYKTKEDKRYIHILWISCIAIVTSWILGLWSIYQNTINDSPTRQQIEMIIQTLPTLQAPPNIPAIQQVDSLIKEIKNERNKDDN